MKINRPDVVKMPDQRKDTASEFVVPNLDFVIITTRDEKRLGAMEIDSTNRSFMFVKAIDERAHTIIPKLNGAIVQTGEDPWTGRVEREALDAITLRFKLGQHCVELKLWTPGRASQDVSV